MVRPGFSDLEDSAFIPGGARWERGGVLGPDEEPGEEGVRPRAGWSRETRTQSRRVAECGRRQVGRGGALGAGTGGCEDPSPGGGGGPARLGRCRAEDRRGAFGGGARSLEGGRGRSQEPFHGPPLPREGRFPPGRRPGPAGSRARVCGNPSPAPPRPAPRGWLGLRGARGARRAAASPDMSGPRAGFYRQELNKTLWEVPQRLRGLRPVGSGAYGSVW